MKALTHKQLAKGILREILSLGGTVQVDLELSPQVQHLGILFTPGTASPLKPTAEVAASEHQGTAPPDQLSKDILTEALSLRGTVEVGKEVVTEVQHIDIHFTPTVDPPPATLGLLGELAQGVTTIFESFDRVIEGFDMRESQAKLFTLMELEEGGDEDTEAESQGDQEPFLWILVPAVSPAFLRSFDARPKPDRWPSGVYEMPSAFRTGIIAISELPRQANTLWLRLLGTGAVQQAAIAELRQLSEPEAVRDRVLVLADAFEE